MKPQSSAALVLISAVLGVVLIPAIFTWPTEKILFNPDNYQSALVKGGFYAEVPSLIFPFFQNLPWPWVEQNTQITPKISDEISQRIFRAVIPDGWVETQGKKLLVELFAFLNFKTNQLELTIELRQIRSRLRSSDFEKAFFDNLPTCDFNTIQNIINGIMRNAKIDLPLCKPPTAYMALINQILMRGMNLAADKIPEYVVLFDPDDKSPASEFLASPKFQSGFNFYRKIRLALRVAPWMACGVVFILFIVGFKKLTTTLGWLGSSLTAAGLVALLGAGFLWMTAIWVNQNAEDISAMYSSIKIIPFGIRAVSEVGGQFASKSALLAAICLGIGMIIRYISSAIRTND